MREAAGEVSAAERRAFVETMLITGVEDVARADDCNAIDACLSPRASWFMKMLHDRGYSVDTCQLCKRFDDGDGAAGNLPKG